LLKFKEIDILAGDKYLFKIDSLEVNNGLVALVGRNGSGKSTFIKTLLRDIEYQNGSISLDDVELKNFERHFLAKKMSVVYSRPQVFGEYNVKDILMLGRIPYQNIMSKVSKTDEEKVEEIISKMNLTSLQHQNFDLLSDGEKQLVMIARAFIQDTKVILLDEPAAFLDLVNRFELIKLLRKLASEEEKLIIFSTHHVDVLEDYCDAVLLIENKSMVHITERNLFVSSINKAFKLNEVI
jgi:iron complex transport system ATP-binding protein